MIGVTKTYLPDLEVFNSYLKKIWKSGRVVNHGPYVLELEKKLKEYLGVKYLFLTTNGTLGLQISIKALNLTGEIITTPFSYVASTSSIVWEGCKPKFVDIDSKTLCIDASKIESAITKNTSAILAVHVYGNVCNTKLIEKIAYKHHLKVIYDSAHSFGVKYDNDSIFKYGDINVLSFHATKIFHTIEGGAVLTNDDNLAHKISYLRNFGHNGEEAFFGLGINGKMSEFQAVMGLTVLPQVKKLISIRKKLCLEYDRLLQDTSLNKLLFDNKIDRNYSYYPVLFDSESQLLRVRDYLNTKDIFPRRYFYPCLTKLPYVEVQTCPIAENVSKKVLCLPLYHDLKTRDILNITELIKAKL